MYLHGLLNRPIDCIEANFPRSYNISNLKRSGVFAYNVSGIRYDFGISEVRTPSGFMVPCLDKERTICDMFLYDICDVEEKQYAMRTYLNGTDAQLDKLYSYAEKLKVEKQVIAATEVLI